MTIFVDADSCPKPARELVIRTVKRRPLRAVFAANRPLPLETGPEIVMEVCPPGEGSADNRIVELARQGDLVITRDVPLASRLLDKAIPVIDDRGRVFTRDNIRELLSLRDFMVGLAESGLGMERISSYGRKELKSFADTLDRELRRLLRQETMDKNNNRAIIFDMDGVLTDSEWFIAEAGRLMFLETHHAEVTHDDFSEFVGMGENRFLGGVAEKYRITDFCIERDKERTYAIYADLIRGKLKPMPGALEFVRAAKERGLKIAVATSTDYPKMASSLQAIGLDRGIFDAAVNGLDVEQRKPFPDLFLEAARRANTAPENCWVVEDSVSGVRAAKAAGMRCLGLLTTTTAEAISSSGADLVAPDLSAVSPDALFPLGRTP